MYPECKSPVLFKLTNKCSIAMDEGECRQIALNLGGSGVTRRDVHSASTNIKHFNYLLLNEICGWRLSKIA